jgi:hypothetical protein
VLRDLADRGIGSGHLIRSPRFSLEIIGPRRKDEGIRPVTHPELVMELATASSSWAEARA